MLYQLSYTPRSAPFDQQPMRRKQSAPAQLEPSRLSGARPHFKALKPPIL